jgi:hypothetical protein
MFVVLVGEANDAPTLSLRGAQVMRCLAILVEVTRYLAVTAGVAVTTASEAGWLCASGGGCTSSKMVGLGLVVLALPLAELWVLPYKGPEAAWSVSSHKASPYLLLVLGVLPPLVLVVTVPRDRGSKWALMLLVPHKY